MEKQLSIIIIFSEDPVINVITTAWSMSPKEVIVVMNKHSNTDQTKEIMSRGCKIIITEENSKNEGYVKGLKKATGEIILFLSGNSTYNPSQLTTLLNPIKNNHAQVVLNNLAPKFFQKRMKQWPDSYTLWRQVFNDCLGYRQLNIDSIDTFPHAYTIDVVKQIGYESFENLVIAHMRILQAGFTISRPIFIETDIPGSLFTPEQSNYKAPLTVEERFHMELYLKALSTLFQEQGVRYNYHDGGRRRDIIKKLKAYNSLAEYQKAEDNNLKIYPGWGMQSSIYEGKQLSIIIPAQNEEKSIASVIKEARKIEPLEIIVVVNGSTDQTEDIAKKHGATVVVFKEALGHDVGRAIGAFEAKGDILLFTDADFPIPAYLLHYYSLAIASGTDVALNDLNLDIFPLYVVNLYKYLLNIVCDRKQLGVGSLVAIPHAISRSCLKEIGWETLLNPCLAHVKAILKKQELINVKYVDVMQPNRIRPDQHMSKFGHPKAVLRINGDHLEAIAYLLQTNFP